MIKLYTSETKTETDTARLIGTLPDAMDVKICSEINGEYSLSFNYPSNGIRADELALNKIAFCEGQPYRIMTITSATDDNMYEVFCLHVYDSDAPTTHIPTIDGMYGTAPRDVIVKAFEGTDFTVLSYDAVSDLKLTWVGADGFLIDFETMDKTSPYSVVEQVIENCGFGEIYRDGYNIALVKSVGGFNRAYGAQGTLKLSSIKNMSSVSIERDMSSIVNRLYPYGENDAGIASVTEDGNAYIESETSIDTYGLKEGYRDYSDYKEPSDILRLAQWEFSDENSDRIDMPSIGITGNIIDLSVLEGYGRSTRYYGLYEAPALGKGIRITDLDGTEYIDRITKLVYYPDEPEKTSVTIGHIRRDESFYMQQMGRYVGLHLRAFGR